MIPKYIHFVWIGPPVPWWAHVNMERFQSLNPGFICHLHGEEVLLPQFRDGYEAIEGEHEFARKSDLLRLSALLQHGGWYFDCDFLPLRPLDELYSAYGNFPRDCFLTQGTPKLIANGIIGSTSSSVFLDSLKDRVTALTSNVRSLGWGAYGPSLYTDMVRLLPGIVQIGGMDEFYPFQDRVDSMAAYLRMSRSGFDDDVVAPEFEGPLPFMMHMSMQDEQELGAVPIQPGFPRHMRTEEEGTLRGLVSMYEYVAATGRAGIGVEVGCYQGESSEIAANFFDHLTCVDNWGPGFEGGEEAFDERMAAFDNCDKFKLPSQDAAPHFENGSLDLVYIDAMHDYDNVKQDILSWFPKVRMGGYVCGHDYSDQEGHMGVVQAVNELLGPPEKLFPPDRSWLFKKTPALCERVAQCTPAPA